MDPFSFATGSIAVLGTLMSAVSKSASILQGFKDAPLEIQALSEETVHLRAVIEDIVDSAKAAQFSADTVHPLSADASSHGLPTSNLIVEVSDASSDGGLKDNSVTDPLKDHVENARELLRRLEDLVEEVTIHTADGQVKFNRLIWLTKRMKSNELRKDLSRLKISLATLLLTKNVRQLSTAQGQMQSLATSSRREHNVIVQLLVHVLRGQSDLSLQIEELKIDERVREVPDDEFEGEERGLPAITEDLERASNPDEGGASTLNNSTRLDSHDALPEATVNESTARGEPQSWSTWSRVICRPLFLSHLFGRIVIGVRARTNVRLREGNRNNQHLERRSLIVSYYFPSWLIARQIVLRCNTRPLGSPQASLYMRRLLPADSPLLRAIGVGDVARLQYLLEKGLATPDDIEPLSFSALTCAISMNKLQALKFLLHAGGDVLLEDSFGNSALDFAWIARLENRLSPVLLRFLENSTSFFLKSEDDPGYDALDKYEFTSVHRAVLGLKPKVDLESEVMTASRALLDETDILGKTPLLWAARRGDFEAVKLLLSRRADPNIADTMQRTPLHMACRARHVPIIKELLHHGAEVSAKNFLNELPAHYAAYEEACEEMLEVLIQAGTDVNAPSKFGKTMLDIVVQSNNGTAVRLLLDKNASPNGLQNTAAISDWMERPAGRALAFTAPDALKVLVERSDLTFLDSKGRSILHIASQHANSRCLKILAECLLPSSLIDHHDKENKTAQDLMHERQNVEQDFEDVFENMLQSMREAEEFEVFHDALTSQATDSGTMVTCNEED